MKPTTVPALALLLLLAPGLLAQETPQDTWPETARALPWPDGGFRGGGAFGKALAADVTGDLQLDAIVLQGTVPVVGYGPAVHEAFVELPVDANDFDVVPRAGGRDADELVVVNDAGVTAWRFDYAGGTVPWASTLVRAGAWRDARAVRVADLDGDGQLDLVGLAADGRTLLLLRSAYGTPVPLPAVDVGEDVLALAVCDWEGDGADEVAVVTPSGLAVLRSGGAVVGAAPLALERAFAVAFRQAGYAAERLALLVRSSGASSDSLVVVDATGVEPPLDLGALDAYAASAGDIGRDGDDDLMVAHQSAQTLLELRNQSDGLPPGTAPTFALGPQASALVPYATSPQPDAGQLGWPCLADFWGDGDDDVLVPFQEGAQLALLQNRVVTLAQHQLRLLRSTFQCDLTQLDCRLDLSFQVPLAGDGGFSEVEVVRYEAADLDAAPWPEAAEAEYVPEPRVRVELDWTESSSELDRVHYMVARYVQRTFGGKVVAAGPPVAFAFTADLEAVEALDDVAEGGMKDVLSMFSPPGFFLDGRVLGSGIGKLPKLPKFDDATPPKPFTGTP